MARSSESDISQHASDDQASESNVSEAQASASTFELADRTSTAAQPSTDQAIRRIREFYESGVKVFTKEAIADLASQIDSVRKFLQNQRASEDQELASDPDATEDEDHEPKFLLRGLDGKTVNIEKLTKAKGDPTIRYRPYQVSISTMKDPKIAHLMLAYVPLSVYFRALDGNSTNTDGSTQRPSRRDSRAAKRVFNAGVKHWEKYDSCKNLRDSLRAHVTPDKITKVIAFACGTMSYGDSESNSIRQHGLVLTVKRMVQLINNSGAEEVQCFAQDPAYTGLDRSVLEDVGIQILEDPHGFLEVDEASVVISFAAHVPVRQIVTDLARPAAMVWDRVETEEELFKTWSDFVKDKGFKTAEELEGNLADPESSRVREMVQNEYDIAYRFTRRDMGGACVYVRRASDP